MAPKRSAASPTTTGPVGVQGKRRSRLERPATAGAHADGLVILTRRSILEGDQRLVEDARDAISELANSFVAEWEGLVTLAKDEGLQQAGKSRMAVELKRMCGEFLLGSLADRGFLPGHGFPTDVVSFMPGKEFKSPQDTAQDGISKPRWSGCSSATRM